MALKPSIEGWTVISGPFSFSAKMGGGSSIKGTFDIEMSVPDGFPKTPPTVIETSRRIPRDGNFHVNEDGSLCLGSELTIRLHLSRSPTLVGFVRTCLVPYLYAVSYAIEHGRFPWDELAHGTAGMLSDYRGLFRVSSDDQVLAALELLSMKRSVANKKPCACGCGQRLGRCKSRFRFERLRGLGSRKWYRGHLNQLKTAIAQERRGSANRYGMSSRWQAVPEGRFSE
jgi:hypothetical protein